MMIDRMHTYYERLLVEAEKDRCRFFENGYREKAKDAAKRIAYLKRQLRDLEKLYDSE